MKKVNQSLNNKGLTILELMIGTGIVGIIMLAALSLASGLVHSSQKVNSMALDTFDQQITFRSLHHQLTNTDVMRSDILSCSGNTVLDSKTDSRRFTLNKPGDQFSFFYSHRRSLGATDMEAENSIRVANAVVFRPGMLVMLTSLDAARLEGVFTVSRVDTVSSTVELSREVPSVSEIPCSIKASSASSNILNRLVLRKFNVDIIRMASYRLERGSDGTMALDYLEFPSPALSGSAHRNRILSNVVEFDLAQIFRRTSETKGDYAATAILKYQTVGASSRRSSPDDLRDQTLKLQAGYRLNGIEVSNAQAVPEPIGVDDVYATCSISAVKVADTYKVEGSRDFKTIYRLEGWYSEADSLGQRPVIATAITPLRSGGAVRCWRENQLAEPSHSNGYAPTFRGRSLGAGFNFEPATTEVGAEASANALVKPVFCEIPTDATITGSMNYMLTTAAGYQMRNIQCSGLSVEADINSWTYDSGGSSKCWGKGEIFIGRLRSADSSRREGPRLYTDSSSCQWSGTSSTSCNAFKVRMANPRARLQSVTLLPSGTIIDGDANRLKILCD